MMPMEQVGSGEGQLEAGDGLMKVAAVQMPKALDEFDQPRRHGEDQRKLAHMVGGQQRAVGRIWAKEVRNIQ